MGCQRCVVYGAWQITAVIPWTRCPCHACNHCCNPCGADHLTCTPLCVCARLVGDILGDLKLQAGATITPSHARGRRIRLARAWLGAACNVLLAREGRSCPHPSPALESLFCAPRSLTPFLHLCACVRVCLLGRPSRFVGTVGWCVGRPLPWATSSTTRTT